MNKIICALLLSLPFAFFSCNAVTSTEYPEPINFEALDNDPTLLTGQWDWVRETYYFTVDGKPSVRTPKSTGIFKTLIFDSNGFIEFYENDELVRVDSISGYFTSSQWGVNEEMFAISWAASDGPEIVYRRIQ